MTAYFRATFASLSVRNYRLYFIGQSVSVVGTGMQRLATAWLVLDLTESPAWLGATLAVSELPFLLITPWAGLVADRVDKRKILIATSLSSMIPAAALAVLTATETATVWLVMFLSLLLGLCEAMGKPARLALPSEMVGRDRLTNALTLNNLVQAIGKGAGPAIAGVMIATVGMSSTFLVNALSFLVVVVALMLMNPAELWPSPVVVRGSGQLRDGLRYVSAHPELLGPLVFLAAAGTLVLNIDFFLPLIARAIFDEGPRAAGLLLGAYGLGSVIGAILLAGVLRPNLRRILSSGLAFAGVMIATALSPTFGIAMVLIACLGPVSVVFRTLTNTWLQLNADAEMRGRVMGLFVLAIGGSTPFGALLLGWLAAQYGTRFALAFAGIGTVLAALATFVYLRRKLPNADWSSSNSHDRHAPKVVV